MACYIISIGGLKGVDSGDAFLFCHGEVPVAKDPEMV
jgi:hypothetical protein